jgi:hypothetical protein
VLSAVFDFKFKQNVTRSVLIVRSQLINIVYCLLFLSTIDHYVSSYTQFHCVSPPHSEMVSGKQLDDKKQGQGSLFMQ